jgi:hypothetical protein
MAKKKVLFRAKATARDGSEPNFTVYSDRTIDAVTPRKKPDGSPALAQLDNGRRWSPGVETEEDIFQDIRSMFKVENVRKTSR